MASTGEPLRPSTQTGRVLTEQPTPVDDYPLPQTAYTTAQAATSDLNFYDRSYFSLPDRK